MRLYIKDHFEDKFLLFLPFCGIKMIKTLKATNAKKQKGVINNFYVGGVTSITLHSSPKIDIYILGDQHVADHQNSAEECNLEMNDDKNFWSSTPIYSVEEWVANLINKNQDREISILVERDKMLIDNGMDLSQTYIVNLLNALEKHPRFSDFEIIDVDLRTKYAYDLLDLSYQGSVLPISLPLSLPLSFELQPRNRASSIWPSFLQPISSFFGDMANPSSKNSPLHQHSSPTQSIKKIDAATDTNTATNTATGTRTKAMDYELAESALPQDPETILEDTNIHKINRFFDLLYATYDSVVFYLGGATEDLESLKKDIDLFFNYTKSNGLTALLSPPPYNYFKTEKSKNKENKENKENKVRNAKIKIENDKNDNKVGDNDNDKGIFGGWRFSWDLMDIASTENATPEQREIKNSKEKILSQLLIIYNMLDSITKQYNSYMDDFVLESLEHYFYTKPACKKINNRTTKLIKKKGMYKNLISNDIVFCPDKRLILIFVGESHAKLYRKHLSNPSMYHFKGISEAIPVKTTPDPRTFGKKVKCVRFNKT